MNYILKQSKCSNGFVSWHLMSCSSDADKLNSIIALDEPSILICNFPKITPWSSLVGQCKVETVNEPEIEIVKMIAVLMLKFDSKELKKNDFEDDFVFER